MPDVLPTNISSTPYIASTSNEKLADSTAAEFTTAPEAFSAQDEKVPVAVKALKKGTNTIRIILHGETSHIHVVEGKDFDRTVEDLSVRLIREKYDDLGPAAVQLFGLASIDSKANPKIIWKNPRSTLEELKKGLGSNQNVDYYVRVRFVPKYEKQIEKLAPELGSGMLEYLFYQCSDDFVSDRFKKIFGKHSKSAGDLAKRRGWAILLMMIHLKKNNIAAEDILKTKKLEDFLPPGEVSGQFFQFWKRLKLEGNMKAKLSEYYRDYQNRGIEQLMYTFVQNVVDSVQVYGIETYEAVKLVTESNKRMTVSLLIDVHVDEADKKGLYINEVCHEGLIEDRP